jgi:cytohesin
VEAKPVSRLCVFFAVAGWLGLLATGPARADNELLDAIAAGDAARIKTLIAGGADVNKPRAVKPAADKDFTRQLFLTEGELMVLQAKREQEAHTELPLHAAITLGKKDLVKLLLDSGADPEKAAGNGKTALHVAVRSRDADTIRLLLARRVPLEARDARGCTPFRDAAAQLAVPIAETLAAAGADVNAADNFGRTALHVAVESYSSDLLEFMLARKADLNAADKQGQTPLHLALIRRSPEMVGRLLTAGAKADTADADGLTPLHATLWPPDFEMARRLLDAGARADGRDKEGRTLLFHAFPCGPAAVRFVLSLKVDVNAADAQGATALHKAVEACANTANEEALVTLLRHGADGTAKDKAGKTPLDVARERHCYSACRLLALHTPKAAPVDPLAVWAEEQPERKRYEDVKKALDAGGSADGKDEFARPLVVAAAMNREAALLELLVAHKADVNARAKEGQTALDAAVASGSWLMVRTLLETGAKVNTGDGGVGILNAAVKKGSLETARLLLDKGADPNAAWHPDQERGRWDALFQAVASGDPGMVELLLEHKADVNARGGQDNRPLLVHAWESKHPSLAKRLLEQKGVDVKAASESGVTLLYLAARDGDEGVVRQLLERGAPVKVATGGGLTPLAIAIGNNHLGVVKALLDGGAAGGDFRQTAAHEAARAGYPQSAEVLGLVLDKGADPNARDGQNRTPLHVLLEGFGTAALVRLLLKNGADVDARDGDGKTGATPLHVAALRGHEEAVRVLLAARADVKAVDAQGHTALYLACLNRQTRVAALLLERNADPNVAAAESGLTALHQAVLADNPELVALLLKYQADRKATDAQGRTPLDVARERKNAAVLEALGR